MADKMNEDAEKLKGFLFRIIDEHKAACRKHSKFCDMLVDKQTDWNRLESIMKSRNDEYAPPYYGENILLEEVAEAFNAYSQGKLEQSLQEFAQCGAVILRCMQFVRDESNSASSATGEKENEI